MLLTKIGFEFIFTKPIMIKWQNDKVNGLFFVTDQIAGLRHLVNLLSHVLFQPHGLTPDASCLTPFRCFTPQLTIKGLSAKLVRPPTPPRGG